MWSVAYWKETAELAIRGGAQMVLVAWAVGDQAFNALTIDTANAGGFFLGGVLVSVLTSLAFKNIGNKETPVAWTK